LIYHLINWYWSWRNKDDPDFRIIYCLYHKTRLDLIQWTEDKRHQPYSQKTYTAHYNGLRLEIEKLYSPLRWTLNVYEKSAVTGGRWKSLQIARRRSNVVRGWPKQLLRAIKHTNYARMIIVPAERQRVLNAICDRCGGANTC
jgi:hypothetical protein